MVNVEKRLKFSQEKPIAPMSILIMFIGYIYLSEQVPASQVRTLTKNPQYHYKAEGHMSTEQGVVLS